MAEIVVRQARLADTHAITDLHCSTVEEGVFTRRNSDGTRTPVPYEELSLFERFMNGGPWMSVETCAVWIAHLLRHGDEIPLVAEVDGLVLGEAEVTVGNEPAPYGRHLNITSIRIHSGVSNSAKLAVALLAYIQEMARVMHMQQVLVARPAPDISYTEYSFKPIVARQEVVIPARIGRVVYKAVAMTNFSPRGIDGWYMPFGRYQSARHDWNRIWPGFWNGVPELVEPEAARYDIELAGQRGKCLLQQDRYVPQRAAAFLWTERPLTSHMVSAVRDRVAREGYEELSLFVDNQAMALVEAEATEVHASEMLLAWRTTS
ncbi:MAG: hypothetical protein GYB66_12970 [Chloroflexi bacterium]|nr:hypothetical protein [Chloroflexota bacterium]